MIYAAASAISNGKNSPPVHVARGLFPRLSWDDARARIALASSRPGGKYSFYRLFVFVRVYNALNVRLCWRIMRRYARFEPAFRCVFFRWEITGCNEAASGVLMFRWASFTGDLRGAWVDCNGLTRLRGAAYSGCLVLC